MRRSIKELHIIMKTQWIKIECAHEVSMLSLVAMSALLLVVTSLIMHLYYH